MSYICSVLGEREEERSQHLEKYRMTLGERKVPCWVSSCNYSGLEVEPLTPALKYQGLSLLFSFLLRFTLNVIPFLDVLIKVPGFSLLFFFFFLFFLF